MNNRNLSCALSILVVLVYLSTGVLAANSNLLDGATINMTMSNVLKTNIYSSTNTTGMTLVDDVITSQYQPTITGLCSPAPWRYAVITWTFTLPQPIYYRTLITYVTQKSLADSQFLAQKVSSYYGETLTDETWVSGKSFVQYTTSGKLIYADKIVLQITSNTTTTQYCLDSVIATDSHYMRVDYIYEWIKYNDTSIWNPSPALTASSIPFNPKWSAKTADCRITSITTSFVQYALNIKLNPDSGLRTDWNATSLVTSVYVQFGVTQKNLTSKSIILKIQSFCYNSVTKNYDSCYYEVIPTITGNIYQYFPTPYIGTYVQLISTNILNEICSFQVFVYNNCDFTITSTTSSFSIPVGSSSTAATSLVLGLNYTIGSAGVRHDDFCQLGVKVQLSYSSLTSPELVATASIANGTLTITPPLSSSSAGIESGVIITVYDSRNSSTNVYSDPIIFSYNAACLQTDLAGALVKNATSGSSFVDQIYRVILDEEQQIGYQISNKPSCLGFLDSSTTVAAKLVTAAGVILVFGTDEIDYILCEDAVCLWHDTDSKILYWTITDETLTGINKIYIVPTFYGQDGLGEDSQVSLTYSDANSGSFSLAIWSCTATIFGNPTDISTTPYTVGTPNFVTKNNVFVQVTDDPADDQNYPWSTKLLTFTDSVSLSYGQSTFCGPRSFQLEVASTETNGLAEDLISCYYDSCLKITSTNSDYGVYIELRIKEEEYALTTLSFTLKVYLQAYNDIFGINTQPYKYVSFTVQTNPDLDCTLALLEVGAEILDAVTSLPFTDVEFQAYISPSATYYYKVENLPVCNDVSTTVQVQLMNKFSEFTIVNQDLETFDTCVNSYNQSCFYHDLLTKSIQISIKDESFVGINQFYLPLTLTGTDSTGATITYTQDLYEATYFDLMIDDSCLYTEFYTPTSNYSGSINNLIVTNYADNLTLTLMFYDSYAEYYLNHTFCGKRMITSAPSDTETQTQLADSLLQCNSSCLNVSTSDQFNYLLNLYVGDDIFEVAQTQLHYTINVYLDSLYQTISSATPVGTYYLTVTINPSNGCKSTDDLKGVLLEELLDISYEAGTEGNVTYTVSPASFPTCDGFVTNGTVNYTVFFIAATTESSIPFSLDFALYTSCNLAQVGVCLYHDEGAKMLNWKFWDDSFVGQNQIIIVPTVKANKRDGNLLSLTYDQVDSAEFLLTVSSGNSVNCMQTYFYPPIDTQTNTLLNPVLNAVVMDYYYVATSADKYSQENFHWQYVSATVADYYGDKCGERTFEIAVSENNTNFYAPNLLTNACTSCLLITSNDGYTATISLRVMDLYLANQTFIYSITVYLKQYHDTGTIGEPYAIMDFYIHTTNTTACVDQNDLSSVVVAQNSTGEGLSSVNTTIDYLVDIDTIGFMNYTLINQPVCTGYNSSNTTYAVKLEASDGTEYSFTEDQNVFSDCLISASSFCLGHAAESQILVWAIFDNSLIGLNTVYIVSTLTGTNIYGDYISTTTTGSFILSVGFNNVCMQDSTDLLGGKLITNNQTYSTFFNKEGSLVIIKDTEPICVGYQSENTTYAVVLTEEDGVSQQQFGTDVSVYDSCVLAAVSTCLLYDESIQTLKWSIFNEQITGMNTVYIIPTLYATDYYGVQFNYTYTLNESTQFTLNVTYITCYNTVFSDPVDIATGSPLTQVFGVTVLNYMLIDSDKYSDTNFIWTSFGAIVSDSVTEMIGSNFCGERIFQLSVASYDQSGFAEQLLNDLCTSCLNVSSADGQQVDIKLRVMDVELAGQTFYYTMSVYLMKYHSNQTIGEPVLQIPFNITIANATSCINSNWLSSAKIQNATSLQVLTSADSETSYIIQIDQEATLYYQITSEPTCQGYNSTNTSYTALIVTSDQVSKLQFGIDYKTYSDCVTAATGTCLYHNQALQKLYWYAFNNSATILGSNVVYIVPTLTGTDVYGDFISHTYTQSEAASFNLTVIQNRDCLYESDLAYAILTSTDQSYEVFVDSERITTYSISQLPSCVGYNTASFTAKLVASDGISQYAFGTDAAIYAQCVAAASSFCLFHDSSNYIIKWTVFNDAIKGVNTVYIIPTLTAKDHYGNTLTKIYADQDSGIFTLTIVFESCMSTQFLSPIETNGTVEGMPNFEVSVKQFNQVNFTNDLGDENFVWTQKNLYVNDTLALIRENVTLCGDRIFKLVIGEGEVDTISASQLLSPTCTSCLKLTQDGITASLAVRIMDDQFENLQLQFTLQVYLYQYHLTSVVDEPQSSYDFTVTISACSLHTARLLPADPIEYTYIIGQTMNPISFTVNRVPNCAVEGTVMLVVNSTTSNILDSYGIQTSQKQSSDNSMTTIYLSSSYNKNTYLDTPLAIQMNYTLYQSSFSFQPIIARYTCQVTKAIFTPSVETKYTYTIGTVMSPLTFVLQRSPNCPIEGTLIVMVGTSSDSIEEKYGITTQQFTDSIGSQTTVLLASSYQLPDLAEQELQITLLYTIESNTFTFPQITATYKIDSSTSNATALPQNNPPVFKLNPLNDPDPLPCLKTALAQKWSFQFPDAVDEEQDEIFIDFTCNSLKNSLIFLPEQKKLILDLQGKLPDQGAYSGKVTLYDSSGSGATTVIIMQFWVDCDSSKLLNNAVNPNIKSWSPTELEKRQPKPSILKVSNTGEIQIQWSTPMLTNLTVSQLPKRQLQQTQIPDSMLSVKLIQQSNSEAVNPQDLNFTYDLYWKTNKLTVIEISFTSPQKISIQSSNKDKLMVKFNDSNMFMSVDYVPIKNNFQFEIPLPKQLPIGTIQLPVEDLQTGATIMMASTIVLGFFLSAILNQILSIVENLAIILHMFILSLEYPVNVQNFFAAMFPLITFDMFPTDDLYQAIFDFENIETLPLTDQFDQVGYSYTMMVQNMGSLFMVSSIIAPGIAVIVGLSNICFPIWRLCKCGRKHIQPRVDDYQQNLYWNGVIKFIDQSYLILLLMSMIGLTDLRLDDSYTIAERFNSIYAIFVFSICILFPFLIGFLYWYKIGSVYPLPDLDDRMQIEQLRHVYRTIDIQEIKKNAYTVTKHEKFMQHYGSLVEQFNMEGLGKTLFIVSALIPILRKFVFASGIILFLEYPVFTITAFNYCILFYVIFVEFFRPMKDLRAQKKQILTEYVLLIVNYHLFCLTDWTEYEEQQMVGDSIVYFVSGQTLLMFAIAIFPMFREMRLKYYRCRYRNLKKKLQKRLQERIDKNKKNAVQLAPQEKAQEEEKKEDKMHKALETTLLKRLIVDQDRVMEQQTNILNIAGKQNNSGSVTIMKFGNKKRVQQSKRQTELIERSARNIVQLVSIQSVGSKLEVIEDYIEDTKTLKRAQEILGETQSEDEKLKQKRQNFGEKNFEKEELAPEEMLLQK